MGVSVVNALSEWLEVTVKQDGGEFYAKFERGKTVIPLKRVGNTRKNRNVREIYARR